MRDVYPEWSERQLERWVGLACWGYREEDGFGGNLGIRVKRT